MGDPAGIGPEIALSAWRSRLSTPSIAFAVFGDPGVMAACAHRLGWDVPVREVASLDEVAGVFDAALPVVPVAVAAPVIPGRPDTANGAAVIGAIDRAVEAVMAGRASAVVTCPIAKSVLYEAGFRHPGHTEYLAHLAVRDTPGAPEPRPVMMLAGADLRVVPVTIHVPLADVPRLLGADLIAETIKITHAALVRDFGIARPRIAVAGLNPHAGESGSIGTEDRDLIAPVVARLREAGLDVAGPLPADTMFHAAARARYDAAVCMYHDQALIPIKTLAFDTGVNITLGLPFVRTSPDHGTAFDIAGRGVASDASLMQALIMADRMVAYRARAAASTGGRL